MIRHILTSILIIFYCGSYFSQSQSANKNSVKEPSIGFLAHKDQKFGFDGPRFDRPSRLYEKIKLPKGSTYAVPYKSVGDNSFEQVHAELNNFKLFDPASLQFFVNDSSEQVSFYRENDTLLTLFLPKKRSDYFISARYKGRLLGKLNVEVFKTITENIAIVSLVGEFLDEEYLEEFLNEIYKQANIRLDVINQTTFSDSTFNKEYIFQNPSADNDRYTEQMKELRDRYFEKNPKATKNAYYIFIIPGFVNEQLDGYMARNHAIGFVRYNNEPDMFHSIARELGHGVGMLDHYWKETDMKSGTTLNLMDRNGGSELMHFQWQEMRHSSNTYSFYDGDEDVKTNNGMVAYYLWEEDKDGFIELNKEHPLEKIIRPFKKNYLSYHLNIQDRLFEIVYEWNNYFICVWHLIIWGILVLAWVIWRIVLFIRRKKNKNNGGFFKRKLINWSINSLFFGLVLLSYFIISGLLKKYEVTSGLIADFNKLNIEDVRSKTFKNNNLKYDTENQEKSEVLIKRGNDWYMKRKKRVLYFDVFENDQKEYLRCKLVNSSDSLILSSLGYRDDATTHYFVLNFKSESGSDSSAYQRVYNHLGVDVTDMLELEDAAKRILVFVNGYRPTSVGHSFEDNFTDIRKNGLEFPNSANLIYNFDRYDYWSPWNNIDKRFKKRINPSETYYADGHFSVTTSNHESLLNFTHLTSIYPKRCKNPKKHVCWRTVKNSTGIFGDKTVNSYDLLPKSSNKKGFKERYQNGRIAAKNLLQMFNEIPNKSHNDTIYFVAHSMGYAYSLGMIEELRGKINFGGFYILAPENAAQGKVYLEEWQEVWQYGSKLNKNEKDPPCLQDGVAPQSCAGGLSEAHRAYIPNQFYRRKGFFDSHFVGYYTWIFDIEQGRKGAIKQR